MHCNDTFRHRFPHPANGLRDGEPGGVRGAPRPLEQDLAVGPPRHRQGPGGQPRQPGGRPR